MNELRTDSLIPLFYAMWFIKTNEGVFITPFFKPRIRKTALTSNFMGMVEDELFDISGKSI